MLRKLLTCLICLALCRLTALDSLPIDLSTEIEQVEEFPIGIDTLEEFIQSYYSLLDSEEYLKSFSFIRQNKNNIQNASGSLSAFLYKLLELRSGIRDSVSIYQIGDSHIKPGFFSTTARSSLIEYFEAGTAGSASTLSYQFKGIIGASFQNLLANDAIFKRCRELKPDLIIISLGTNDAQGNYNAARFRGELRAFMNKLKAFQSTATVLFTLPPDGHKQGRHNADIEKVSDEIASFAKDEGYAWWDLAEVMGGKNSISKWRAQDFASKDLIHFSPKGYMLQGHLFYNALMKAYKDLAEAGR